MQNYNISRRQFVVGLSATALALGVMPKTLLANLSNPTNTTLSGTKFNLEIGTQMVNFTGSSKFATTVNNSLPAPILRFKEGEMITLNVKNNLNETTSIHWHGLILPSEMDGVPGISTGFDGILPGQTFTYTFKAKQSGTYWYHSHSGFQEQTGLYGAIVIDPADKDPVVSDKDYVFLLSDWTDENPTDVYKKLKKLSHYYNTKERTHQDLISDIENNGFKGTFNERKMWSQMRMSQRDLSDVTASTYTYLANGQTPNKGWVGLFDKGDKIRIRFINASAMTFFDVRIPGLKMTIVASDGQNIEPISVDEFRIGVAETYDAIIEPKSDMAYTIFAQDIARTGYARGTITTNADVLGEVPELDKVADLNHLDMGMDMSSTSDMAEMDHSKMGHAMPVKEVMGGVPIVHKATEYGPHIDMLAEKAEYRLDDPGVGLRNNGRTVLTYADIYNLNQTENYPDPDRELQLHLTGNMGRYMWSIDGVKFTDAQPLHFKLGEVIRITLVNDTMMNHPMHLHGMWSDLETGDNMYIPRKHTVIVQPGAKISYRVIADAEGGWAYHCHLLYHMLGMFRHVIVS